MIWPLKNLTPKIVPVNSVGDFAYRRSFYHHPGIDIYCDNNQEVLAIEDGVVVNLEVFTGPMATPPSPWWNETHSILIEGSSGVLGYCELTPVPHIKTGVHIKAGDVIAHITPVLKKDKGNGTTMLHFEQYEFNTREHVTWVLDSEKPKELMNPRDLLQKIVDNQ
jgi:murein DD-endopeptidase MepM/ murein hydrolase activator NlpD